MRYHKKEEIESEVKLHSRELQSRDMLLNAITGQWDSGDTLDRVGCIKGSTITTSQIGN